MDVAVMLRLLTYGWTLFAFCTFWCCVLLMPINGTAGFLVAHFFAAGAVCVRVRGTRCDASTHTLNPPPTNKKNQKKHNRRAR